MTVVYVDGFDMYNGAQANIGLASRYSLSVAQYAPSATTPFTNGQSMRIAGDVQFSVGNCIRSVGQNLVTSCVGFYFKGDNINSNSTRSSAAMLYLWDQNANAPQLGLQLLSSGIWVINRYSATGTITAEMCRTTVGILGSTWYHMALVTTIDDTVGTVELWIDGVLAASATGLDTKNTANAFWNQIYWYNFTLGASFTYIDDFYITDQASFLGIRRVETLRPSADTAQKQWTPNSGTANFSRVNEATVDGDTSYVSTTTVGFKDLYDFSDLSSNPALIDAVQVTAFPRKTDATARTLCNSVKSGSTNSDGTAYALNVGYLHSPRLMNLNPDGSVAWTYSAVNALQGGPKLDS